MGLLLGHLGHFKITLLPTHYCTNTFQHHGITFTVTLTANTVVLTYCILIALQIYTISFTINITYLKNIVKKKNFLTQVLLLLFYHSTVRSTIKTPKINTITIALCIFNVKARTLIKSIYDEYSQCYSFILSTVLSQQEPIAVAHRMTLQRWR